MLIKVYNLISIHLLPILINYQRNSKQSKPPSIKFLNKNLMTLSIKNYKNAIVLPIRSSTEPKTLRPQLKTHSPNADNNYPIATSLSNIMPCQSWNTHAIPIFNMITPFLNLLNLANVHF